ncbi:hypothetical protein [Burkholderia gladioli]|uniref:Uncharacterized protein n=1 Tax=Burkholderia gladioli TaxID=28095 RepID=A0AB38U603_BURGA|nr:hypothetical protein [Burkholderia gladioli]UWX75383.1 hypothetical protein NYZ96_35150 [Burkholderia gladioli]
MTSFAMTAISMPADASTKIQSEACSMNVSSPLNVGDVLTGPTMNGVEIDNVTLSCGGLDAGETPTLRLKVECGGQTIIASAKAPGYNLASLNGFQPVQASGPVTATVIEAPAVGAMGSVTMVVDFKAAQ